jgi:hypothetical protein
LGYRPAGASCRDSRQLIAEGAIARPPDRPIAHSPIAHSSIANSPIARSIADNRLTDQ